jgi:FAD/FMN-containing dehydrogenase
MGGQQFCAGAMLIDMRGLNRVCAFDETRGQVTVEGGIQWPALLAFLATAQRGRPQPWGIYQKQTGADRLTIAGALSCNAHGRGLTLPPIVDQVESFVLMNGAGDELTCSRTRHPGLFALAIGGYGLFGIITRVTLRLQRALKLRRVVEMADTPGLIALLEDRVRSGFLYGDFQFAIDDRDETFLRRGVCSCYEPVASDTPLTESPVGFSAAEWAALIVDAHGNKRRAFERFADRYVATSGQIYGSDEQLSAAYTDDYHAVVDRALGGSIKGSEMITELYVPRDRFEPFMAGARAVLRQRRANVVYGTVRLIERDTETVLAWAREPWACIVLNLHIDHTSDGVRDAGDTFRALIDAAIRHGGTYYLTYHRWARPDQIERGHPAMRAFLEAKHRYDPDERFQSDWYRWHRQLFDRR